MLRSENTGNGRCDCEKDSFSLSPEAQEMLSASISQTRILQTCGVPHPNMVSGANLQGNEHSHYWSLSLSQAHTQKHMIIPSIGMQLHPIN